MDIYVIGLNHKRVPIQIREKFAFSLDTISLLSIELLENINIKEVAVLCTCNRIELYAYATSHNYIVDIIEKALCKFARVEIYENKKYFNVYQGKMAISHLFNVTSGLDSMLIGEDQILRQIKDTIAFSFSKGYCGKMLNTLFRYSITSAKKVKTITSISCNTTSLASISVQNAYDFFNQDLTSKTALVIGAGKMGLSVVKHLLSKGIPNIFLTNRTHQRVVDFSKNLKNITGIEYSNRYNYVGVSDIIISCTSSPHYTLTKDSIDKIIINDKPRIFIDLAVPRDFDPSIAEISGAKFLNVDALGAISDKHICERQAISENADEIIQEYLGEFEKWYSMRNSTSTLKKIDEMSKSLIRKRIAKIKSKNKYVNSPNNEIISDIVNCTAKDFLNAFIYNVKEHCNGDEAEKFLNILEQSFDRSKTKLKHY